MRMRLVSCGPDTGFGGGQIVYQTIEGLKGSPLSERSQIIGQQFGILALILLMSFAFYNDIARILG